LEIPTSTIQTAYRPVHTRKYAATKYLATGQYVVARGEYQLWATVAKAKQKRYLQKHLIKAVVRRNYKKIKIEYLSHKSIVP
jgi:hypothetical protein